MSDAILRAECLTKRFGGLTAVSEVSLELHVGQVHAVIGPNGAGKSTLVNLISGDLPPSAGAIHFRDETQVIRDLAGQKSDRIARLGIGRSYQKTNIFLPFTVFENCRIAAQSRLPSSMRFIRPRACSHGSKAIHAPRMRSTRLSSDSSPVFSMRLKSLTTA